MHILHALTLGFLSCCTSTWSISAASAQVNGPGPSPSSSFDTVLNLPGNASMMFGSAQSIGGIPGQTTQLNIDDGGTIGFRLEANSGSEVNVSGGRVGNAFDANSGSEVNVSGGTLGGLDANSGSHVTISNGNVLGGFIAIDSIVDISGGTFGGNSAAFSGSQVSISGGDLGRSFNARSNSQVNISGGVFGDDFEVLDGGEVNISGGIFDDNFDAFFGSKVNLFGSSFFVDGVELELDVPPGQPFTITERDVTLSGLLTDGQQFSFDLNSVDTTFFETEFFGGIPVLSEFDPGDDFFDRGATLTVTLTVPEPSSTGFIAALFALGFARRHRR